MASSNPKTVVDIDFLPASYREAGMQRKNVTLRLVVVVAFVAMLGFAIVYQQNLRWCAERQLSEVLVEYERAKLQNQRLAELNSKLQAAERRAELFTYLRHPWPRSQLLAAVVERLPDELEFSELCILRETTTGAEKENARPAERTADATQPKPAAELLDLTAFRQRCDGSRVVVKLSGVSEDAVALHRYLDDLGQTNLFSKVDVGTIERLPGDASGRLHFTARVFVRTCYGQPGGPDVVAESGQ